MKKSFFVLLFTVLCFSFVHHPVEAEDNGKVVILDPGHGGIYGGTSGYSGVQTGYYEKKANLDSAIKIQHVLEDRGYTVHMTRTTDKDFGTPVHNDLRNRMELANKWAEGNNDNSIFLSIHHNAAPYGPGVRGYETYYFDIDNGIDPTYPPDDMQIKYSPESKRLANLIHSEVLNDVSMTEGPQGITGNDLYVTRNAQMPSALLELGYMSNPQEEKLIKSNSFQQQFADAVGDAVDKYFSVYEVYDYQNNRLEIFHDKDAAIDFAKSKENVYVLDKISQKRIYNNLSKRYGVYHSSNASINQLFYTEADALEYSKSWKHTRVVDNQTGEILWSNYLPRKYTVVHPSNGVLFKGYQADTAISYAKKWKHTAVVNTETDEVLWTNYLTKKFQVKHQSKGTLKEFYHEAPAVDYAKQWDNTKVVNSDNGSTVWNNSEKDSFQFNTKKVASNDREKTAVEVSKELYPNGFPSSHSEKTVLLSTASTHADALSAGPLAAQLGNAPILLTASDEMRPEVVNEINRLGTKRVILLGGPNAISTNIESTLKSKGYKVDRIAGEDRIGTNQKINAQLDHVDGAIVASSTSFPDALGAAPVAAINDWAIVLTDDKMDDQSLAYTDSKMLAIVGGTGVVSSKIEDQLIERNGKDHVIRLAGTQRYQTQEKVLDYFQSDIHSSYVLAATGRKFPDALTASSLAVKYHAPLVLIGRNIDPATKSLLTQYGKTNAVENLRVVGGVLSDKIIHNTASYLK
ncbi:N-acetylmuramoyl-L-alanine amidase [Halobacillus rhizosphaerae]|uniref:cell wall-binding repeat-containing protein n=1 Tax=Halobacillus rhizosphaerae TaxID=3064889 RepID=UPI00398B0931